MKIADSVDISLLIFGKSEFLLVARAILHWHEPEFEAKKLANSHSGVPGMLKRLSALEMVEPLGRGLYRRTSHGLWDVIEAAELCAMQPKIKLVGFGKNLRSEAELAKITPASLELGSLFFGAPLRMRLMLWLFNRTEAIFNSGQYNFEVDDASPNALTQLKRLEQAGFVAVHRERKDHPQFTIWKRLPTSEWHVIQALWDYVAETEFDPKRAYAKTLMQAEGQQREMKERTSVTEIPVSELAGKKDGDVVPVRTAAGSKVHAARISHDKEIHVSYEHGIFRQIKPERTRLGVWRTLCYRDAESFETPGTGFDCKVCLKEVASDARYRASYRATTGHDPRY